MIILYQELLVEQFGFPRSSNVGGLPPKIVPTIVFGYHDFRI